MKKKLINLKVFIEGAVEGRILGPVNAPIFRLKRKFRVRLLIRGRKSSKSSKFASQKSLKNSNFPAGMKLTVDVDPINFN